ncbi:hypothetical protein ElyMa_003849200 [Elysia marginata]|uniref:Uncharacterized protein n=1 Tax=Elysia marginata TaxID=1093978 RepID=A0AAV4FHC9_9GAST|nr:hypothetical protein ElyMa_003849200 [Elysia marginata]
MSETFRPHLAYGPLSCGITLAAISQRAEGCCPLASLAVPSACHAMPDSERTPGAPRCPGQALNPILNSLVSIKKINVRRGNIDFAVSITLKEMNSRRMVGSRRFQSLHFYLGLFCSFVIATSLAPEEAQCPLHYKTDLPCFIVSVLTRASSGDNIFFIKKGTEDEVVFVLLFLIGHTILFGVRSSYPCLFQREKKTGETDKTFNKTLSKVYKTEALGPPASSKVRNYEHAVNSPCEESKHNY